MNLESDLVGCSIPLALAKLVSSVACRIAEKHEGAIGAVKQLKAALCTGRLIPGLTEGRRLLALMQEARLVDDKYLALEAEKVATIYQAIHLFWKQESPLEESVIAEFYSALNKRVATSGKPKLSETQKNAIRSELDKLGEIPYWERLTGANGPGSVADGYKGIDRWWFTDRPCNVPSMFYRTSIDDWAARPIRPVKYGFTKAVLVPKDVRGPRAISEEKLSFQHAQFAIEHWLNRRIHKIWSNNVSLHDQRHHCRFLRDRQWVTVDLSDASDYISRRLVYQVFPERMRRAFFECRSTFMSTPVGVAPLRTFAPMGSSLCFIVMTTVIIATFRACGVTRPFSVYGDDIIVHYEDLPLVLDLLSAMGLRTNDLKTTRFTSAMRESCGEDYIWDGETRVLATPVFIKASWEKLTAVSALRIAAKIEPLREIGFYNCGEYLYAVLEHQFPELFRFKIGWHKDYQRVRYVYAQLREQELPKDAVDGYPGYYRSYVVKSRTTKVDKIPHGRPAVGVKRTESFIPPTIYGCLGGSGS
jgi:hypothetical protein